LDYNEFVKEEKLIKSSSTLDDYKNFMDKNEADDAGVQPQERVQDEACAASRAAGISPPGRR
jgi:hypothetical protein